MAPKLQSEEHFSASGLQAACEECCYLMGEQEGGVQQSPGEPYNIQKLIIPGTKVHFIFT